MVSKIQALEMMKRISHHVTDECILERIVPFLVSPYSLLQVHVHYVYSGFPREILRHSRWAWFHQSLWTHQTFGYCIKEIWIFKVPEPPLIPWMSIFLLCKTKRKLCICMFKKIILWHYARYICVHVLMYNIYMSINFFFRCWWFETSSGLVWDQRLWGHLVTALA